MASWEKLYRYDSKTWKYVLKDVVKENQTSPNWIIYVRVSTDKQVSDGNWLESQEKKCREFAKLKNINIVAPVFVDWWVSWASEQKDWLEKAIKFLENANKKDLTVPFLICTEISRITRMEQTEKSHFLIYRIRKTGARIFLANSWKEVWDDLETDIWIAIAKNERLLTKERTINGLKAKMWAWDYPFQLPPGYDRYQERINWKKESRIKIVEPEATIVKEWLEMYASGTISTPTELLNYFKKSGITTKGYHWKKSNEMQLWNSYASNMLETNRLYFYAGYIIYPPYEIFEPIPANHPAIISLSTVNRIIERIEWRWPLKSWIRKDINKLFPLRGLLFCPNCWYALTWWTTKWHGWLYDYYGCKHSWCKWNCNIDANLVHDEYKKLLETIQPKPSIIKLMEAVLKDEIKIKEEELSNGNKKILERIKEIDMKIEWLKNRFDSLSNERLKKQTENEWAELESEKEHLNRIQDNSTVWENDIKIIFDRVKTILTDPVAIWRLWSLELKHLQAKVYFWDKIYYKKNEGFLTPHLSALYKALVSVSDVNFLNGALKQEKFKPICKDFFDYLLRTRYITGKFYDSLQNEMNTCPKLKESILKNNLLIGRIPIKYIMNN